MISNFWVMQKLVVRKDADQTAAAGVQKRKETPNCEHKTVSPTFAHILSHYTVFADDEFQWR